MSDRKELRVVLSSTDLEDAQQLADRLELGLPNDAQVKIEASEPTDVSGRAGVELVVPIIALTIDGIQAGIAAMEVIQQYREKNENVDVQLEDLLNGRKVTLRRTDSQRKAQKEFNKLFAGPSMMQRIRMALGRLFKRSE